MLGIWRVCSIKTYVNVYLYITLVTISTVKNEKNDENLGIGNDDLRDVRFWPVSKTPWPGLGSLKVLKLFDFLIQGSLPASSEWPIWEFFSWPFHGISDLHCGDKRVTWKKPVYNQIYKLTQTMHLYEQVTQNYTFREKNRIHPHPCWKFPPGFDSNYGNHGKLSKNRIPRCLHRNNILAKLRFLAEGLTFSGSHLKPHSTQKI